jgi:hypothetical protein
MPTMQLDRWALNSQSTLPSQCESLGGDNMRAPLTQLGLVLMHVPSLRETDFSVGRVVLVGGRRGIIV